MALKNGKKGNVWAQFRNSLYVNSISYLEKKLNIPFKSIRLAKSVNNSNNLY